MGTKVQANAFLRECHSVIDLDGSTSNGMMSLYHESKILKNGENPDSFTSYDPEKVRQTILKHESIFRNQLQELHRLYGRQRELMNEIKRREINKDDVKEEKCQSSYLFSPILREDAKIKWNPSQLMNEIKRREINKDDVKEEKCQSSYLFSPILREDAKIKWYPSQSSSTHSGTNSKLFSFVEDKRSVTLFPPTQDKRSLSHCDPRILNSSIFSNGTYNLGVPADVYSSNMEKQMQERYSKLPVVESNSERRNHQASYDRDNKFSLSAVQTSQHNLDALTLNFHFKRNNNSGDTDGIPDRLALSRGESSVNSCSNFNFVTKDFFQNSLDRMNNGSSPSVLGLRNERSGKEHLSDDSAVKFSENRRFDTHSSVGDFYSGKSLVFPQSQFAEARREPLNRPSDMGTSISCRTKKIFGVEICEGNDDPLNAVSNMSSLDRKVGPHHENHCAVSPSSWITNSLMQNLELAGTNVNYGKKENSDMKGKWVQDCSSIGSNFVKVPYHCAESDPKTCFKNLDDKNSNPAEHLKKDSEHSHKLHEPLPQLHVVDTDCQSNHEKPKGGLPWFLRNSQVSGDLSNGKKSSYFMNLDSLQNCSQKFFGKAEIHDGTFQTSKQKMEFLAPMASQDAEGGINEANDGTSAKKLLGFPISNVLQSFKDPSSGGNLAKVNGSDTGGDCARKVEVDETKDIVLHKGLNNYISDLKHHIDLNLSLDEEDAPSAPSVPTAIVKIATTEIDLEASAVIESEMDASPEESRKMDISPGNSELPYEECDKVAAEAMIAISFSVENKLVDDESACEPPESASIDSLKWFAEIVSSQCGDSASILVEVSTNQTRACDEEEESIPDGMDYFEYMTLKLEDTKEKHYHYEPFVLNNPSDDETGATQTKRSRRGQSRRGRQRKDFQRDILPGLVTLSRLEVKEDFQAFEELLKAEGSTWQSGMSHRSSTRNGRGRKRLGGATTSPTIKTPCSTQAQQPICQIEERSLTGWGKRTRRLPRQRCPNALLSFPVKC